MTTTSNGLRVPVQPRSVQVAVGSVFVGVTLHVISLAIHLAADRPAVPGAPAELTAVATGVGSVATVLVCAVGVFFAMKLRRGTDWARVTLAVFAVLELFAVLANELVVGSSGPGGWFAAVIVLLIGLAALVFLAAAFQRPANEFFAESTSRERTAAGH